MIILFVVFRIDMWVGTHILSHFGFICVQLSYFYQGGLMISFGSVIDDHLVRRVKTVGAPPTGMLQLAYKRWSDVSVISMPFHYDLSSEVVAEDIRVQPMAHDQEQKNVVMVEVTHEPSDGVALLAQVSEDDAGACGAYS